jgi:hypothetical protein
MLGIAAPAPVVRGDTTRRESMFYAKLLACMLLCAVFVHGSIAAVQLVPAVGLKTRVGVNGNFEIAAAKRNGTHAPFTDFELRGVALGFTPVCASPDLDGILQRDFHALLDQVEQLGANTIRAYDLLPTAPPLLGTATAFLDHCYELGVYVIVTTPSWSAGNPAPVVSDVQQQLAAFGNHPALLAICVGNEWTLDRSTGAPWPPAVLKQLALDVEAIALASASADPKRVVMTSVHEHPDFNFLFNTDLAIPGQTWIQHFTTQAPSIGLWGLQLFRAHTLQPTFFRWMSQVGATDAWLLSEFGADSFDTPSGTSAPAVQAAEITRQWDEVHRFSGGPFATAACAGSVVFELADEWWKDVDPCAHNPSSYATDICTPVPSSPASICYAGDFDGRRSEEYLGLNELVPPSGLLAKPSFGAVLGRLVNAVLPVSNHQFTVRSQGFLTGGGLANGYAQYSIEGNTIAHVCGGCATPTCAGCAPHGAGLSLLRFDRSTGGVIDERLFATLTASGAAGAAAYVQGLPNGALVGVAIVDSLHLGTILPQHAQLIAALQAKLGVVKLTTSIQLREGWAAIGIVGAAAPLDEATPLLGAPVEAAASIAFDLDADGQNDALDSDLDGDAIGNLQEQTIGTDPVDPRTELYVVRLSQLAGTHELLIEVRAGHPSANFQSSQLDLSSFSLTLLTPVHVNLAGLFPVLFTQVTAPLGGVAFQSIVPVPAGLDLRVGFRIDQTDGEILIDALHLP